MPLFNCPECNSNISTLANSCPSCGFPLTDEKLLFRLAIPAIPKEIWDGLRKGVDTNIFLSWNVNEGDWVKSGEVLASYNVFSFSAKHYSRGEIMTKATINAPITGKISAIKKNMQYTSWDWSSLDFTGTTYSFSSLGEKEIVKDHNILFYLDSPVEYGNRITAYNAYENIIDYGYFARKQRDKKLFRKSLFVESDFPIEYLEGVANTKLILEKI